MKHFRISFLVTAVCLLMAGVWGYRHGGAGAAFAALGLTMILGVMEVSLSFDGVIGAFAITNDVVIIMLGLAIGAMFVRSMTVYLVRQGTLEEFIYLEHGAHYAIGVLALIMLASMKYHVSEIFTGLIGVAFILASVWASVAHKRNSALESSELAA